VKATITALDAVMVAFTALGGYQALRWKPPSTLISSPLT
jgi:hypothetical protein